MCYAYPPLLAVPALLAFLKVSFDRGSRPYVGGLEEENSVGSAYDEWTAEGILEYYWGEHIHLGYYTEEERARGYLRKDFIQAKYDFVDRMMEWGGVDQSIANADSLKILDVGCGIGGTSRYLANKVGDKGTVTGITLSKEQVKRGMQLAKERNIPNVDLRVMDALNMEFPDNSFDVVWACESGEHMPDKKRYVEEMTRVLKPGGKIVIATWCQRDGEFEESEKKALDFLYTEWAHPFFISIQDYVKIMNGTDKYSTVGSADWAVETLPAWRHSIWVGVFDPWPVVRAGPKVWWKTVRDGVCLERMHRAFDRGLMEYGMMRGTKAPALVAETPPAEPSLAEA
jgi:MPBQ/MSBQ methyltransferase